MADVEVEGLRIGYERAGSGPPVVLVHGFVGAGRSTWSGQIEGLSDEFTVVAWDAPGAGRSAEPPEWFRLPDYAECLAAFVLALGLDRPHMVGLSFGGMLLIELCRRREALPRTLVLAGAYAGWAGSLDQAEVDERRKHCLWLSSLQPDAFADAIVPSMFSASVASETVAQFAASVRAFNPAGFRAMTHSSADADLRGVLPHITVPTLLLYGDQDTRAPVHVAQALRSAMPSSRLAVMPGVGHVSSVEAPELFNREVRQFLRSVPSDSSW